MRADALAGSVALVTGAARPRGIGRATALALAAAGADVACLDIARPYESAPAHALASGDDLATVVARTPSAVSSAASASRSSTLPVPWNGAPA